jgi:hypothetical protein
MITITDDDFQFYSKEHEHIGERFARFAFVSFSIGTRLL